MLQDQICIHMLRFHQRVDAGDPGPHFGQMRPLERQSHQVHVHLAEFEVGSALLHHALLGPFRALLAEELVLRRPGHDDRCHGKHGDQRVDHAERLADAAPPAPRDVVAAPRQNRDQADAGENRARTHQQNEAQYPERDFCVRQGSATERVIAHPRNPLGRSGNTDTARLAIKDWAVSNFMAQDDCAATTQCPVKLPGMSERMLPPRDTWHSARWQKAE
ncbi:hypothetical protein LXN57_31160 [Actinoplanes sp. TRM88002]|uniref:Uncharacterized protein n=1 Tax=Paractinoplanes hotanensis TaxID=2906497 RepID=A0ABT0Y876_9ACTN|nr:hypothetical protein [Actinoplanes hotanensis]MCM4082035.1 hypothetical protein [Actinoplanes hotanensis]